MPDSERDKPLYHQKPHFRVPSAEGTFSFGAEQPREERERTTLVENPPPLSFEAHARFADDLIAAHEREQPRGEEERLRDRLIACEPRGECPVCGGETDHVDICEVGILSREVERLRAALAEQPRGEPTCDCGHAADDHDNVRPNGERVIDRRETPCERCSCIDFQAAEQPEGEAVLRVEWLHEEFENRSSPMVWPKCGPASATHRRLVSDWMPIVRSAK